MSAGRIGVVGLGAIGSMTVRALARRGHDVLGIDLAEPGHDDAGYGGRTRQSRLATQHVHSPLHVDLVRSSASTWEELEQTCGEQVYVPTGQLVVAPEDSEELRSLRGGLDAASLPYEQLTREEVADRFPAHRLADGETALFAHEAGVLRSNLAVATAVAEARTAGAEVRVGAVDDVTPHDGGVRVVVDGEPLVLEHVVVTAGAWSGRLLGGLNRVVEPRIVPSVWFEDATGATFAPGGFPPGFRRRADGTGFTYLPSVAGDAAKFVVWNPRRDVARGPGDLGSAADAEGVARATAQVVRETIVGLDRSSHATALYVDGFTPDRWPVVDTVHGCITTLAGFSGGGFAISPAMGAIAADLATGIPPDEVVRSMSPARFETDQEEVAHGSL